MKNYWIYILILVLTLACIDTSNNICENQQVVISSVDSLPEISLDFNLPNDQIENLIRSSTKSQDKKGPQKFGFVINGISYNASIHSEHLIKNACYGMPSMRHQSPQLEVSIYEDGMLVVEGKELISCDSLPRYIAWYFPNDKPYGEKVTKLNWANDHSKDEIERTISKIAQGYLGYYESESSKKFNKPFCSLNKEEYYEITKKYPFEIRLWMGDVMNTLPSHMDTNTKSEKVEV